MGDGTDSRVAGRGMGRVHFLALLPAIRTALEEGWTMKTVFERHRDGLRISTPQCTRTVGQYVTAKPPVRSQARQPAPPPPPAPPVKAPGFHYNPVPKIEDLI